MQKRKTRPSGRGFPVQSDPTLHRKALCYHFQGLFQRLRVRCLREKTRALIKPRHLKKAAFAGVLLAVSGTPCTTLAMAEYSNRPTTPT